MTTNLLYCFLVADFITLIAALFLVLKNNKDYVAWTFMLLVIFLIGATLQSIPAKAMGVSYPDKQLTPGAIDSSISQENIKKTICIHGETKDARHVTLAMKKKVFDLYDLDWKDHAKYEVDHDISLELAGSNDISNLWPQFYCKPKNDPMKTGCWGAREKDFVETSLHREICKGEITLKQGQDAIRNDWIACYKQLKAGKKCEAIPAI